MPAEDQCGGLIMARPYAVTYSWGRVQFVPGKAQRCHGAVLTGVILARRGIPAGDRSQSPHRYGFVLPSNSPWCPLSIPMKPGRRSGLGALCTPMWTALVGRVWVTMTRSFRQHALLRQLYRCATQTEPRRRKRASPNRSGWRCSTRSVAAPHGVAMARSTFNNWATSSVV